jgi:hypothetical protein
MKSDNSLSGVNRRVLLSGLAMLPALSAFPQSHRRRRHRTASWRPGTKGLQSKRYSSSSDPQLTKPAQSSCRQNNLSPPSTRTARYGSSTQSIRKLSIAWTAYRLSSRKIRN